MICKKCGAVIPDDAKFCNVCGESQEVAVEMPVVVAEPVVEAPVIPEPVVEAPVYEAPVVEQPVYQQPIYQQPVVEQPVFEAPVSEPVYAEEAPKGGKGLAITSLVLGIVGLVFAFGAICCCGVFFGIASVFSVITAIIGLVLASVAKKKGFVGGIQKAGFILNIICLITSIVLFFISVILVVILAGSGGLEDVMEDFMEGFEEGFSAGTKSKGYSSYYDSYYSVKSVFSSLLK